MNPDADPPTTVTTRLGVTAGLVDGALVGWLEPQIGNLVHGAVRASAVAFLADALGALDLLADEAWHFTSDLSVRMPAVVAPARIEARIEHQRTGRRTSLAVPFTADGTELGVALVGFARVERRPDDPPKPVVDLADIAATWALVPPLDEPVRDAVGLRVLDATGAAVELALQPEVRNSAGALHGGPVALVVEAAAEELATVAAGAPQVVTDLDIRYLSQARSGPVRTRGRFIGPARDGSVLVEMVDAGLDDKLLAVATLRTHPAPT